MSLIQWGPPDVYGLSDQDVDGIDLSGQPGKREKIGTWFGINGYVKNEWFVLQLFRGKSDRMAMLQAGDQQFTGVPEPLQITDDHVADAAGFLGFKYFEWLETKPGLATIFEEQADE